jgi:TetR/AcrR family transcriptional regulator, cholesterol catabolism regulator
MENKRRKAAKGKPTKIHTNVKDEALVEKRREQICKAALQAFAQNGFHETNLREITKLSGLAYGSIYNYVKTKDDILYLICDSILSDLFHRVEQASKSFSDPVEQVEAIIRAAMDHADEHREAVMLLWQESKVLKISGYLPEVVQRERSYLRIIAEVLERGTRLGVFNIPDSEITILVNILPLTCSTWALRSWNLGQTSKAEYTEALIDFVLQGIGVVRGKDLKRITTESRRAKQSSHRLLR